MPRTSSCFDGIARTGHTGATVHFTPREYLTQFHWEVCPPLKKVPRCLPNFTGVKFGRFTVVGMHALLSARWVVRCVCGDFEVRTTKAVRSMSKSPDERGDRCANCQQLATLKKRHFYDTHGHWPANPDSL